MEIPREDEGQIVAGDYKAFLGGLSWETSEDGLMMYFKSIVDDPEKVLHASINRDRFTGQPRGFGFVSFADPETLAKVCEAGKHSIDGKDVEVKTAIRKDRQTALDTDGMDQAVDDKKATVSTNADFQNPEKKLFVGGLLCETTEEDLAEYFGRFGKVSSVVIKYDADTHRSRGFGFVTFETMEGIDKACEAGRHHMVLNKRVEIKRYQRTSGPAPVPAANETEQKEKAPPTVKRYQDRRIEDVYEAYFDKHPPPGVRRY